MASTTDLKDRADALRKELDSLQKDRLDLSAAGRWLSAAWLTLVLWLIVNDQGVKSIQQLSRNVDFAGIVELGCAVILFVLAGPLLLITGAPMTTNVALRTRSFSVDDEFVNELLRQAQYDRRRNQVIKVLCATGMGFLVAAFLLYEGASLRVSPETRTISTLTLITVAIAFSVTLISLLAYLQRQSRVRLP